MNHSPENSPAEPTAEEVGVEEVSEAVDALAKHATQLERAGSDADVSPETVERVRTVLDKVKRTIKYASLGLLLLGGAKAAEEIKTYSDTRYEITKEVGEDGTIEYVHEDAETTRILNFLTGAAELPEEDKIHFYRELLRQEVAQRKQMDKFVELGSQGLDAEEQTKQSALTLDEQIAIEESLPTDEAALRSLLRSFYEEFDLLYYGEVQPDIDERVDQKFKDTVDISIDYDPILEQVIWEMQQKVGAPRIRWSAPDNNSFSKIAGHAVGAGRSMYNREDNTIYITPGTTGKNLLAENAHAEQFNDEPVQSRAQQLIDELRIQLRMISEGQDRYTAQLAEYERHGSIEHDAHEVREGELLEEMSAEYERIKAEQEKP